MYRLLYGLLVVLLVLAPVTVAQDDITLEPFTLETLGLTGLKPAGWGEVQPGTFARDPGVDPALLLVQGAPISPDEFLAALLPQLGLDEAPEAIAQVTTDAFTWDVYYVEVESPVGVIVVDLALTDMDGTTIAVLMQAAEDDYETLNAAVFVPAVDALAPLSAEATVEPETDDNIFSSDDGLYTITIPTNWTAEQADGYAIFTGPNELLFAYTKAAASDDIEAAIADFWAEVQPDLALEITETLDIPAGDAEAAIIINYEADDDSRIYQAVGQLYEDRVYMILFDVDFNAAVQRQAQLQILLTSLNITALERDDLTGVEPLTIDATITDELEAYIVEMMDLFDIPGASVAIVQDGAMVYANGFGVKDRETGEPVTPETLMMIGSTTKTMTTLLMAQLVDAGLMAWDTPVVDILPSFALADEEVTEQITVQNLVCACTGVPRRDFELIFNADETSAEEVVESLAGFELFTDFGEAFQYSNQMVAAGGYVAALAAGVEYGDLYDGYIDLMHERIFEPLGMTSTYLDLDTAIDAGNYATPYGLNVVNELVPMPVESEIFVVPIAPAGSAWSNAVDMSQYLIMELAEGVAPDGTRIVSAENLSRTWEPQVQIAAETDYGLGWIVDTYKGLRMLHHGGNTLGFTSDMAFLPAADLGIVVLTNGRATNVFNQIVRVRLFELAFGLEPEAAEGVAFNLAQMEEGVAELTERLVGDINAEMVEPYLGVWTSDALGDVTLTWDDEGRLYLDVGEFYTEIRLLQPAADNADGEVAYITYDPPLGGIEVRFETNDDDEPVFVIAAGLDEFYFARPE